MADRGERNKRPGTEKKIRGFSLGRQDSEKGNAKLKKKRSKVSKIKNPKLSELRIIYSA